MILELLCVLVIWFSFLEKAVSYFALKFYGATEGNPLLYLVFNGNLEAFHIAMFVISIFLALGIYLVYRWERSVKDYAIIVSGVVMAYYMVLLINNVIELGKAIQWMN